MVKNRLTLCGILRVIFMIGCQTNQPVSTVESPLEEFPIVDEVEEEDWDDSAELENGVDEDVQNEPIPMPIIVGDTPLTWKSITLKDVKTGRKFKLDDFKGKRILIESFAVWCPKCTSQQKNMQKLHNELGDSIVIITVNTDPNEDEDLVIKHIDRNNFKGLYVVAPKEFTEGLIDDYGIGVVNAPSVPVVMFCENGSSRLLDRGIKSVDKLKSEISKGCNG
jgi:thiol-disulfide isomerase/thioredoxin